MRSPIFVVLVLLVLALLTFSAGSRDVVEDGDVVQIEENRRGVITFLTVLVNLGVAIAELVAAGIGIANEIFDLTENQLSAVPSVDIDGYVVQLGLENLTDGLQADQSCSFCLAGAFVKYTAYFRYDCTYENEGQWIKGAHIVPAQIVAGEGVENIDATYTGLQLTKYIDTSGQDTAQMLIHIETKVIRDGTYQSRTDSIKIEGNGWGQCLGGVPGSEPTQPCECDDSCEEEEEGGGWCLDGNSLVSMPLQTLSERSGVRFLRIRDLSRGMSVLGVDVQNNRVVETQVVEVIREGRADVSVIKYDDVEGGGGLLHLSDRHGIYRINPVDETSKLIPAKEIQIGDSVLILHGKSKTMKMVQIVALNRMENVDLYNVYTETGNLIVDGVLVSSYGGDSRFHRWTDTLLSKAAVFSRQYLFLTPGGQIEQFVVKAAKILREYV